MNTKSSTASLIIRYLCLAPLVYTWLGYSRQRSSNNQVLHRATDYRDFSDTITMEPWIQDAVRCWQIWAATFSERTGLWIFSHHGLG
jgi:hypothetical protein